MSSRAKKLSQEWVNAIPDNLYFKVDDQGDVTREHLSLLGAEKKFHEEPWRIYVPRYKLTGSKYGLQNAIQKAFREGVVEDEYTWEYILAHPDLWVSSNNKPVWYLEHLDRERDAAILRAREAQKKRSGKTYSPRKSVSLIDALISEVGSFVQAIPTGQRRQLEEPREPRPIVVKKRDHIHRQTPGKYASLQDRIASYQKEGKVAYVHLDPKVGKAVIDKIVTPSDTSKKQEVPGVPGLYAIDPKAVEALLEDYPLENAEEIVDNFKALPRRVTVRAQQ